jgi:hypothetical protein
MHATCHAMAQDAQYTFRLSAAVERALKALTKRMSDNAGVSISTAAVLRKLVTDGLKREGFDPADFEDEDTPAPSAKPIKRKR